MILVDNTDGLMVRMYHNIFISDSLIVYICLRGHYLGTGIDWFISLKSSILHVFEGDRSYSSWARYKQNKTKQTRE